MLPFENPLLDELLEKYRQSGKAKRKVPYQIYVAIVGIELVLSSIFLNYAIYFSDFVHYLDCYSFGVSLWTTVVFEAARKIIYCWSHVLYLNGSYNRSYKNNIYVATWFLMIVLTLPFHDRSLPNQIITYGGLAGVCRSFISVSLQMYVNEFQVLHPDEYCSMAHLGTALSFMILPLTAFLSHEYGPHLAQLIMSPIPGHIVAILHWMRKDLMRKELREIQRSLENFLSESDNSVQHDMSVIDAPISTPDPFASNPTEGNLRRNRREATLNSEEEHISRPALHTNMKPSEVGSSGIRQPGNLSSQANTCSTADENTHGVRRIKVVVQLETSPEHSRAETGSSTETSSSNDQFSRLVEQAQARSDEDMISSNERVIPTPSDVGTSMGTSDLSLLCNSSDPRHSRYSLGSYSLKQYISVANSLHNLSFAGRSEDSVSTNDEEPPDGFMPYDNDPANGSDEPNAAIAHVRRRYHQVLNRLLASDEALAVPNSNSSDTITSASTAETNQETGSEITSCDESSLHVQLGDSPVSAHSESEQIVNNETNTIVRSYSEVLQSQPNNETLSTPTRITPEEREQAPIQRFGQIYPEDSAETGLSMKIPFCYMPWKAWTCLYFWLAIITKTINAFTVVLICTTLPYCIVWKSQQNGEALSTYGISYNPVLIGIFWVIFISIQRTMPELSPTQRKALYHSGYAMTATSCYFLGPNLHNLAAVTTFCISLGIFLGMTGLNEKAVLDEFKDLKNESEGSQIDLLRLRGISNIYLELTSAFFLIALYHLLFYFISIHNLDIDFLFRYSFVPFLTTFIIWMTFYALNVCVEKLQSQEVRVNVRLTSWEMQERYQQFQSRMEDRITQLRTSLRRVRNDEDGQQL